VTILPDSVNKKCVKYIGRCIYCGSTEDLSDEHAAPEGIQGTYILQAASCEVHRRVTSRIEEIVLHGMFHAVREHFGIVGKRHKKRAKKRPPRPLTVAFENPDGTAEKVPLILPAHPYRLVMPLLDPPGIVAGRDRDLGFPPDAMKVRIHTHEAALRRFRDLEANDPQGRQLIEHFDIGNFSKFLAKIAYCFAVYFLDVPFNPLILELILSPPGEALIGPYYVGGAYQQEGATRFPLTTGSTHGVFVRTEGIGTTLYVISRIWLFRDRQMPVYDVVVGTIDPAAITRAPTPAT
jgi:hypothetical protein